MSCLYSRSDPGYLLPLFMSNLSTRMSLLVLKIGCYHEKYLYLSTCHAPSNLSDYVCDRSRFRASPGSVAIAENGAKMTEPVPSWMCIRKASSLSNHHPACFCLNWCRHLARCLRGRPRWSWRRGTPSYQSNSAKSCRVRSTCSS